MKLVSAFELHRRSANELSELFGQVSRGLARTQSGTPERRNALATLENIARARRQKLMEMRGRSMTGLLAPERAIRRRPAIALDLLCFVVLLLPAYAGALVERLGEIEGARCSGVSSGFCLSGGGGVAGFSMRSFSGACFFPAAFSLNLAASPAPVAPREAMTASAKIGLRSLRTG